MTDALRFASTLPSDRHVELEALLYFNPKQVALRAAIARTVDLYGSPRIRNDDGNLRVGIDKLPGTQTLFALHLADRDSTEVLAGAVLYARLEPERITVLHLAVAERYQPCGPHGDLCISLRLLAQVREVARRLRGVETISILYGRATTVEMRALGGTAR